MVAIIANTMYLGVNADWKIRRGHVRESRFSDSWRSAASEGHGNTASQDQHSPRVHMFYV